MPTPTIRPVPAAEGHVADTSTALKPDALKGKRFGVLREAMGYHPAVDGSVERRGGHADGGGRGGGGRGHRGQQPLERAGTEVLLYEFKDGLNSYLKKSGAPQASLEALIAWNKVNAARAMPFFGQELFEQAQAKGPLTDAAYIKASDAAKRLAGKEGLLPCSRPTSSMP